MAYAAPVRDQLFVLGEVLNIHSHANLAGFSDATPELVAQIVGEAARFTESVLAPLNAVGDSEGCRYDPETAEVATPAGFKAAFHEMQDAGWSALSIKPEWGGQGLPGVVNVAFGEMSSSANMAFSMYPGLTRGAFAAIEQAGTDQQKQLYLPKMANCQWSGAMNLTEPQCGTDLGLIRSKAVRNADGSFAISGEKIWISSGEHDMAENIVHLVLARIEGAVAGIKGLSLFIVPKFVPDADGNLGQRNAFKCAGLESKMGIHGNSTCVMAYDGATGWLLGAEGEGLKQMFVMMNEARMGVAVQGLSQAEAAYQAAVAFARERLQGRALTGAINPEGPADPIIVHPDVRRMLMDAKAVIEGGRALLYFAYLQQDLEHRAEDEETKRKAADRLGLLTPVAKAYLTGRGFQICSDALQVHGGSGFTTHFPAEQYLRDCRIALIYEGTNGIQALDLVGRKLPAKGGRAMMAFLADCDAYAAELDGDEALKPFAEGLRTAKGQLQDATMWLMQNAMTNPDHAGAAAHDYLELMALTCMAWSWGMIAKAAQAKVSAGDTDSFYAAKLTTGRYFLERILPEAGGRLAKIKSGADPVMALPSEAF